MKKAISNITTGLLEKKINKAELSKIFIDYNEAKMYCDSYSGKMLCIAEEDFEDDSLFIVKNQRRENIRKMDFYQSKK